MSFIEFNRDLAATLTAINKSQASIEFNLDGTILTANPNFLQAMGYTLEEVKGKHHGMFVEAAYRESPEYKVFWETLRRGEFQATQFKRIGQGGHEVWIEATYNPVLDLNGRIAKVVKFATDITGVHKSAEHSGQTVDAMLGIAQGLSTQAQALESRMKIFAEI